MISPPFAPIPAVSAGQKACQEENNLSETQRKVKQACKYICMCCLKVAEPRWLGPGRPRCRGLRTPEPWGGTSWGRVTWLRLISPGREPRSPRRQWGLHLPGKEPEAAGEEKTLLYKSSNPLSTQKSPRSDKHWLIYSFCSGLSAPIYCLFLAMTSVFLIS